MKLTLVGAGSPTFTPFLFKRLLQGSLPTCESSIEVALMDVDPKALKLMGTVVERIYESFQKKEGFKDLNVKISKNLDLSEALSSATYVITTVGVGGFKATKSDIDIPAKFGVFQSIGDTVGPGGIFRGLRHIPVILKVAKTMEDVCPDAYLFNYSNPMTPVTRAVNRETKIRAFGLCTSVWHTHNYLAKFFNLPSEELDMTIAGINHFCLITELEAKGQSLLSELNGSKPLPKRFGSVCREMLALSGLVPYAGDRHTSEFFPNLYADGRQVMRKYNLLPNMLTVLDLADRKPVEKRLNQIASGVPGSVEKLLSTPGWEEEGIGVVNIMESLASGKEIIFDGVNLPNNGAIQDLPSWAIVEVPAIIGGGGIRQSKSGIRLPRDMAAVMAHRTSQYELLVDAATTGDRSILLRALIMDGYVRSIDQAGKMMNRMLVADRKWLPEDWFPSN